MNEGQPTEAVATDPEPADGNAGEADERVLDAEVWGSTAATDSEAVAIDVYVVTGRHGGLRVPESFCRECNLFTRRAEQAAEAVESDVDVTVYSWWTHVLSALRHGGYHPPVLVVGGQKLCQGHHVPTVQEIVDAIEAAEGRE